LIPGIGNDDGTFVPGSQGTSDKVSTGVDHMVQSNPVQRTGRPDGTVVSELADVDGFEADDDQVANGFGGRKAPNGDPSVQRTGRAEVSGLTTLGYPVNGDAFSPSTTNVTSSGGGKISPA
jgi:hypothetical protein